MISPELTDYSAICHASRWRPLQDGQEHPGHYVKLSETEVQQLVTTGEFSLPESVIPESVRKWRQLTDIAHEVTDAPPVDLLEALRKSVDRARQHVDA